MLFNMVGKSSGGGGGGESPAVSELKGIAANAGATLTQSSNAMYEYTINLPRAGVYLLDFTWRFYYPVSGTPTESLYYSSTEESNISITNGTYESLLAGYGGTKEFIFRINADANCVFKIRHRSGIVAAVTLRSAVNGYLYYSGATISSVTKSIALV